MSSAVRGFAAVLLVVVVFALPISAQESRAPNANCGGSACEFTDPPQMGAVSTSTGGTRSLGSPYVPLDDWSYAAFARLAASGLLVSDLPDQRPWTRLECARLVREAESQAQKIALAPGSIDRTIAALHEEFRFETQALMGSSSSTARLESVYSRAVGIVGPALSDGYHFGQTIYNDYGRDDREGVNFIAGASGFATHGPWTVYARGELQEAPSVAAPPSVAQLAISRLESTPYAPVTRFSGEARVRPLDAYVGYTWRSLQVSFGNQSLWWSPDEDGALNFSNNASPVTLLRFSTVHPVRLPWLLGLLGPSAGQVMFGQLRGQHFIQDSAGFFGPKLDKQPLLQGYKFSFKPTASLDFGVSVTTIWGGSGVPITLDTFLRSFSPGNTAPGARLDPGDRRTSFDFRYRIPGLRKWLTLYNDSLAEDELNPIAYPRRSAMAPGIYIPHLPKLDRLDIRAEGFYTDLPGLVGVGDFYSNEHYLSGFTNRGYLLGHPVGRQGLGYQLSSRFWVAPQRTVQFGHRHVEANALFLGGGAIEDYYVRSEWLLSHSWKVSGAMQYEDWRFPLLASSRQNNFSTMLEIVFQP